MPIILNMTPKVLKSSKSTIKNTQLKARVNGFTLIELIVVIFVLTLVTTLTVMNFRNGERRKSVQLGADSVTNTLRSAQNYALAGRAIPSNATRVHNAPTNCSDKAPADYRVGFNVATPTQYHLYATDKCQDVWLIETFRLPGRTRIATNGVGVRVAGVGYDKVQFRFTAPFARIEASSADCEGAGSPCFANATFSEFDHAFITVESNDGSVDAEVQVDAISGRIGI